MDDYQTLLLDRTDKILTVTINVPERLNALTVQTLLDLSDALEFAYNESAIGGIIITGAGNKAFVAGADITEIAQLSEVSARKFSEKGQQIFEGIERCEMPIIAAVNGYALGGGCELAMACHFRTASDNALFGQPEVSLGVIPGYGGTQRLTRLIGKGKAMELMMTGDTISADEALQAGLVNHVFKPHELLVKTNDIMRKILSKAPVAISMVINAINASNKPNNEGYQVESNSFAICCKTEDFREGTNAFIEKRKPKFSGK